MDECTFKPKCNSHKNLFKCDKNASKEQKHSSSNARKASILDKLNQYGLNSDRFKHKNFGINQSTKESHKEYSNSKERVNQPNQAIKFNPRNNKCQVDNHQCDPKIINKPDEAILDLSDSPSFSHKVNPYKNIESERSNPSAGSQASKRLITNKSSKVEISQSNQNWSTKSVEGQVSINFSNKSSISSAAQRMVSPTRAQCKLSKVVNQYNPKVVKRVELANAIDNPKSCESSFEEPSSDRNPIHKSEKSFDGHIFVEKIQTKNTSFECADNSIEANEYNDGLTFSDDPSFQMESMLSICNEIDSKEIDINKYLY